MKPAMHTWSFRHYFKKKEEEGGKREIKEAIDITAEMGFEAMEIMAGKAGMDPGDFASDDVEYLRGIKAYAEKAGVDIVCMSTYNDFAYTPDEEWRLANIQYIKDWLKIAADVGVPNIRMLTGYYQENEDKKKLEDLTLAGIKEVIPVAEETGTKMAVENHNSIFFSADDILMLIKDLGTDKIKACPDPSNWVKGFLTDECAPEERETVFKGVQKLAPYAVQSHLKVAGITDDDKLFGFGDELDRLIKAYKDGGYDGYLAFETAGKDDLLPALPKAKEILETSIDRICS